MGSYIGKRPSDVPITSGDVPDLPASKTTSGTFANARISEASVTQHVTATDLTPVRQDVLTLALKQAVQENSTKFNLPNSSITKFEADADYNSGGSTDVTRDANEYIYPATAGSATYTTYTTGSGNFTVPSGVGVVEALVVAGGGGGAGSDTQNETGGGGGGGGVVHHATLSTTPAGTIAYAIGAGGTAGQNASPNRNGGVGGNSTFGSITALGGGGGGTSNTAINGGSGGGAGRGSATGQGSATQGASGGGTGYGNDGGISSGSAVGSAAVSAGGGGAGAVGGTATAINVGGAGGAGKLFSNFTSYGVSGYFAGGGGGGGTATVGSGSHGGGNGGMSSLAPTAGTANTGGGGGGVSGSGSASYYGGVGGTGFIGLRYTPLTFNATGTALGTTNVPTSAVTDVSGVMLLKNNAGTNTLGTDVKVYFTANNSAFTEVTDFSDAGTFSTGIKMIKLGKKTCTSGSDVRWKIVWANQSSGSKEAHIYGIGLNY